MKLFTFNTYRFKDVVCRSIKLFFFISCFQTFNNNDLNGKIGNCIYVCRRFKTDLTNKI